MHAQNFPSGNITIVVPAAPGGGHDAVARVIGQKLRARLGWTIIVENRGGANGMIAAEAVAKSRADGRTILVSTPAKLCRSHHDDRGSVQGRRSRDNGCVERSGAIWHRGYGTGTASDQGGQAQGAGRHEQSARPLAA